MRAARLALLLVCGAFLATAAEDLEATVSARSVHRVDDRLHLVEVEVLDSAPATLGRRITLVFEQEPPAWTAEALPARSLLLAALDDGYRVVEDRGAVEAPAATATGPAAPAAPSLDELARKGAALALGEDAAPRARWETRRVRVRVIDTGDTLLVECLAGAPETGGAVVDGQLVMVVASDGRFAVISGLDTALGTELELVQEVRVDDGR